MGVFGTFCSFKKYIKKDLKKIQVYCIKVKNCSKIKVLFTFYTKEQMLHCVQHDKLAKNSFIVNLLTTLD